MIITATVKTAIPAQAEVGVAMPEAVIAAGELAEEVGNKSWCLQIDVCIR